MYVGAFVIYELNENIAYKKIERRITATRTQSLFLNNLSSIKLAFAHQLETLSHFFFCLEDKDLSGFPQCGKGRKKKKTFQWMKGE